MAGLAVCRRPGRAKNSAVNSGESRTSVKEFTAPSESVAGIAKSAKALCRSPETLCVLAVLCGEFGLLLDRQPEFIDPVANLIPIEAEQRRRARLVSPRALQGLPHQIAFELVEVHARFRQLEPGGHLMTP